MRKKNISNFTVSTVLADGIAWVSIGTKVDRLVFVYVQDRHLKNEHIESIIGPNNVVSPVRRRTIIRTSTEI